MAKLVAFCLCVGLLGCAPSDDDGPPPPDSGPHDSTHAAGTGLGDGADLDPRERPDVEPDSAYFLQVENDGRGLEMVEGGADGATWTIRYRVSNPTRSPIYLVGCNDPPRPQLQKWLGNAWKPVHLVVDDACRSPAWEIKGDGTLPTAPDWGVLRVTYEPGSHPGTEGDTTLRGTYRLVIAPFTSDPDADLASASQVIGTSAPFEID